MAAHLYLSPHLDDAVFACGGLIANQVAGDEPVMVLTVFAGDPDGASLSLLAQDLHERWGSSATPVGDRRSEDRIACGRLGASVVHLEYPEAIYRRSSAGEPMYPTETALFGPPHPEDREWIRLLGERLSALCAPDARLYTPLGIGRHVDHRLVRLAAEQLGRDLWYYADFPYAARGGMVPDDLDTPLGRQILVSLSPEEVQTWASAVSEYRSQLSTYWPDEYGLYQELKAFHDTAGGLRLTATLGA